MNKKVLIKRQALYVEKVSGKYQCPHYIPPVCMEELLGDLKVVSDIEARKMLAEIAENFALEFVKGIGSKNITKESLISYARNVELG